MLELFALAGLVLLAMGAGKKKNGSGRDTRPRPGPTPLPDESKASGNPPNISGDPDGYNTTRWPNPRTVCEGGGALGYAFYGQGCGAPGLTSNTQFSKQVVRKFQTDYNKISRDPEWPGIRGTLAVDGIVGKNTLNAMEAAEQLGYPWQFVVAGGPTPSGIDIGG